MPYFASLGQPSCAISLRGTASSIYNRNSKTVQIQDHIRDLKAILPIIFDRYGLASTVKPVLVGHSFGGVVVMKLLEDAAIRERLGGAALLCSVPPSGNGPLTLRYLRTRPLDAFKIVYGFALRAAVRDASLCRALLFDPDVPPADLSRYMQRLGRDGEVGLDLTTLGSVLPSVTSADPVTSRAR